MVQRQMYDWNGILTFVVTTFHWQKDLSGFVFKRFQANISLSKLDTYLKNLKDTVKSNQNSLKSKFTQKYFPNYGSIYFI